MERAFRADFSTVRIREGSPARLAGVRAYTRGEDVHVSPGALRTETEGGRELLGHELAHVLQQRDGLVGPGMAGALEGAAERAGARAARGLPVSSIDRDAAPPSPSSPGPRALVQAGGPAQAGRYPIGPPPGDGETDNRKYIEANHQGGDVYVVNDSNRYQLVKNDAGDYLERVSSKETDDSLKLSGDDSLEDLLGGGRSKKVSKTLGKDSGKVLERSIYSKAMALAQKAREGDLQAQKKIETLGRINDPRHPDHKKSKLKQDSMIRDKAKKRGKKDQRGTGNDEGQQTFLFLTALTRDSGLSKDPGIRTVDTGKGGQTVTRMDFHQYNRTPTRSIPLIGGADHYHPGVATSTPGDQDHLSKGNHELDSARAQAILGHHGPATEFGASLVAQVKQMKPPRDVIAPSNIMGYDTQGRDFATNEDAQQDLAFEAGFNREVMKRAAKALPEEYNGSDFGGGELSSDDETFEIGQSHIKEAIKEPSKLPLLFSSYEHPKPRPKGWKYKGKKKANPDKRDRDWASGSDSDEDEEPQKKLKPSGSIFGSSRGKR
jgi:hypothetical protein